MAFKKVVVFTGAGFGRPLGLPTCIEFQETIDDILETKDKNFTDSLRAFLGNELYDIEKFLSTLELFSLQGNRFIKYLVLKHVFDNPQLQNQLEANRSVFLRFVREAKRCISELKSELFVKLRDFDLKSASQLYNNLIGEIYSTFKPEGISFFTTNYDLTFEKSLGFLDLDYASRSDLVDLGYTSFGIDRFVDFNCSWDWEKRGIEFRKLHGSLDWHLADGGRVQAVGVSVRPEDTDKMLLLYPGFKGTPNNQPFVHLHDEFARRLQTCDVILVIGFAFRDEYLNNIFLNALRSRNELVIFYYNPLPVEKLPVESIVTTLLIKHPRQFKYITRGIENTPSPLGLNKISFPI